MTRIGFDATPLLGRRTGIGRYVAALAEHFAGRAGAVPGLGDTQFVATAFSRAGAPGLRPVLASRPDGTRLAAAGRRIPAHLLHAVWERSDLVPVELLTGRLDLFHGTNFVLPPLRSARGVLTVHDLAYLRFPDTVSAASRHYAQLVPRGIERAAVVCTLTAALAADVAAEYGIAEDRIVVTQPGVDAEWLSAVPLTGSALDGLGVPENYLVAVGTVEPRKNLATLVQAHRQLTAEDPDAPALVLAGPPGWGGELGIRDSDRIILTGYLDPPTLRGLVAGARCLAFPSRYEGFGLPPLEALACGVPVVVSDLPATREVLQDQAIYTSGIDADAIAAGLSLALQACDSAATRTARRAYAANWTWPRCAEQVLAAYALALT
jgi:glycosyltransferase involved in cell wall biosynthesis